MKHMKPCNQYIVQNQTVHFSHDDLLEIHEGCVNKHCEKLIFPTGSLFNCKIILSKKIKYLIFGYHYNRPIRLTKQLETIEFGDRYNRVISLSKNSVHLTTGWNYNNQLVLTKKLKYLTLGYHFNRAFKMSKNLRYLVLGWGFFQSVIIDPNLVTITISSVNHHVLENLPDGLENFIFVGKSIDVSKNNLPNKKIVG